MKIHEKRFNLDASINCPSCQEHINKRQLNPHFEKVKDIRTKYIFLSFYQKLWPILNYFMKWNNNVHVSYDRYTPMKVVVVLSV